MAKRQFSILDTSELPENYDVVEDLKELTERNARSAARAKNIKLIWVSAGLTGMVLIILYWQDIAHFFRQ